MKAQLLPRLTKKDREKAEMFSKFLESIYSGGDHKRAKRYKTSIYIPESNASETFKERWTNIGVINLDEKFKDIQHRLYCRGAISMLKVE